MDLPQDLIELFSAFDEAGVRYLLVGGHAVAAHGRPRSTKDVDLWIAPGRDNVVRASRALARFGAPAEIVAAFLSAGPKDIVWLGRPPTRINLLRTLLGVSFAAACPRRLMIEVGGVRVPVIGKADLICNKQTVGRASDLRDVKILVGRPPARAPKVKPQRRRAR
jgi:hypothetical protein